MGIFFYRLNLPGMVKKYNLKNSVSEEILKTTIHSQTHSFHGWVPNVVFVGAKPFFTVPDVHVKAPFFVTRNNL